MSMSTHVVGIKPPDAHWQRMKAVLEACLEADIEVPEEVDDFFGGEDPDPTGVQVEIEGTPAAVAWRDRGSAEGFEIDLSKLPPDITALRFFNSW